MEEFYLFKFYRFERPVGMSQLYQKAGFKSLFELRASPDKAPYENALSEMRKYHLNDNATEDEIIFFIDHTPSVVCYFDECGFLMS